jgi:hypothetical protein
VAAKGAMAADVANVTEALNGKRLERTPLARRLT